MTIVRQVEVLSAANATSNDTGGNKASSLFMAAVSQLAADLAKHGDFEHILLFALILIVLLSLAFAYRSLRLANELTQRIAPPEARCSRCRFLMDEAKQD
jgi:hypothetical protein